MTSDPLDWIARVVMLVLSGMVTLSLIGSIAAIPSGSIETRMGLETQPRIAKPPPLPEAEPEAAAPKMESAEERSEERRLRKGCVRTCRTRWAPDPEKKK